MPHLTDREEQLEAFEIRIGYKWSNKDIRLEALWRFGDIPCPTNGYQRRTNADLALVGDSVLSLVLRTELYKRNLDRGATQRILSRDTSNVNLDRVGRLRGLDEFIQTHPCNPIARNDWKTMSTTVEAILGAVYLDSGFEMAAVREVMNKLGLMDSVKALDPQLIPVSPSL